MNRMPILSRLFCLLTLAFLGGCSSANLNWLTTRVEQDVYTITNRDTIVAQVVTNAPGQRDNGVVYPSSRVLRIGQDVLQYDSLIERKYPDFIRLGLFESVGLIGTSASNIGLGSGLFGIFGFFDPEFATIKRPADPNRSVIFTGGIYRIGIVEKRLRWFNDDPDWTIGNSLYEAIVPQVATEPDHTTLDAFSPIYIRKRFYLREKIPYVAVTAAGGIGLFPKQYLNLSASLDVGSLGGLNFRGYAGYAFGGELLTSPSFTSSIPYIGLGVSTMDFLNRVPETYREWKDHEHSSWDIGVSQFSMLISSAEQSFFATKATQTALRGFILRVTPVSLALPILDNRLYAGTSLINLVVLGSGNLGAGILPLRFGYWYTLLQQELIAEPFLEFNYFPSTFLHAGVNFNINFPTKDVHLKVMAGFAVGDAVGAFSNDWTGQSNTPVGTISGGYFGIGVGLSDRIFVEDDLRYTREKKQ